MLFRRYWAIGSYILIAIARACEDGCSSGNEAVQTRLLRRMQPGARDAVSGPSRPLEWGQINFLHTTDTHGWLAGHLREPNYGADWGDYLSYTKAMRTKADRLGVDLLLIDTGDLHTGTGLSDSTSPPGAISNDIFKVVDYDLLTIGNHELYNGNITYNVVNNFAKHFGNRYLASNVDILNPATGQWQPLGHRYRYFTTAQGLRIMAFGVLYDMKGSSNISRIMQAVDMVNQPWFIQAVNQTEPIDLFLLLGHNPVRANDTRSTIATYQLAIQRIRPEVPIQVFGGHSHIRDFVVYDNKSTALSSGRYCETLGWLSMSGFNTTSYTARNPQGVPNPSRSAHPILSTGTRTDDDPSQSITSSFLYSRRYLDWNRMTFEYHAKGSQTSSFREGSGGNSITSQITQSRGTLGLTKLYGCAPRTWCADCVPHDDVGNMFTLLNDALATVVVNRTRESLAHLILYNGDGIKFDSISQGPFTYDDSHVVVPFMNTFRFVPDVPYSAASRVLDILNSGRRLRHKRHTDTYSFKSDLQLAHDDCAEPHLETQSIHARSLESQQQIRFETQISPGYTTIDDFGTDGDDTPHARIPYYPRPNAFQANASFSQDTSALPEKVDVVFISFIEHAVLDALRLAGVKYAANDVSLYMPANFTSDMVLGEYAKRSWQTNTNDCPLS